MSHLASPGFCLEREAFGKTGTSVQRLSMLVLVQLWAVTCSLRIGFPLVLFEHRLIC
jgi:hypothetical protein